MESTLPTLNAVACSPAATGSQADGTAAPTDESTFGEVLGAVKLTPAQQCGSGHDQQVADADLPQAIDTDLAQAVVPTTGNGLPSAATADLATILRARAETAPREAAPQTALAVTAADETQLPAKVAAFLSLLQSAEFSAGEKAPAEALSDEGTEGEAGLVAQVAEGQSLPGPAFGVIDVVRSGPTELSSLAGGQGASVATVRLQRRHGRQEGSVEPASTGNAVGQGAVAKTMRDVAVPLGAPAADTSASAPGATGVMPGASATTGAVPHASTTTTAPTLAAAAAASDDFLTALPTTVADGKGRMTGEDLAVIEGGIVESGDPVSPSTTQIAVDGRLETAHARSMVKETLGVSFGERGWERALGEKVVWLVGQQIQAAEVKLNPPHLGPVEFRLTLNGNEASLSFTAANGTVRDAIEQALPRLRDLLSEQNLVVVDVNVGQGGGSAQTGQREPNTRTSSGPGAGASDVADDAAVTGVVRRLSASGLVDEYA